MPVDFLEFSRGLKDEHTSARPMLERIHCPPGGTCQAMRVYADGGLYFQDARDPAVPAWSYLTQVKPEGVAALRTLLEGVCSVEATPRRSENAVGSTTFRWELPTCSREVVIVGVDFDAYAPLEKLQGVVNANLTPRAP